MKTNLCHAGLDPASTAKRQLRLIDHGLRVKPAMTMKGEATTLAKAGAAMTMKGDAITPAKAGAAMTMKGDATTLAKARAAMTAILLSLFSMATFAQMSPVGVWRNLDDKTGEAKAEIRVIETAGVVSAKIEKRLAKDAKPGATCTECKDDRKDKPMDGLEIIRGAKKTEGKDLWEGGKILDPENGRDYSLKLTPIEGGKKLEVRGSFGPFGRTQTWVRVN